MHMPKVSVVVGGILVVVGLAFFFFAGDIRAAIEGPSTQPTQHAAASMTALIPAFIGLLFAALGLVGLQSARARKHAMHVAAALALLGILGSFTGITKLISYLTDSLAEGAAVRPVAWIAQSITAIVLTVFLVLAIRSFIAARKARQATGG